LGVLYAFNDISITYKKLIKKKKKNFLLLVEI
jgi:hypothetical protein